MIRLNLFRRLTQDRRGVAAAEFALIAPALIFLTMGVFEMSYRFRASEEATRYVHQVADLIARETDLSTADIKELYDSSIFLMKPLDTTDNLDLDVTSIGFTGSTLTPNVLWRRVAGTAITYDINDSKTIGRDSESVIHVGVRYRYQSILSNMFGGANMNIEKSAYARPRIDRKVTLDGATTDGGTVQYVN